jgi:hypothetical protein
LSHALQPAGQILASEMNVAPVLVKRRMKLRVALRSLKPAETGVLAMLAVVKNIEIASRDHHAMP